MPLPPDNPFAAPSDLPYGLSPFDRIREEHFRPAFEAGMAEQRAEVEAIARPGERITFAGTVAALERTGALLDRVRAVFFNLTSTATTPGLQQIEEEVGPRLAAHRDAILLDPRLFARISALHERLDELGLDPEQTRLVERYHTDLIRAGAALGPDGQNRLKEINQELSALGTTFKNRLLADTNDLALHVDDPAELAGLPADQLAAARESARARGLKGYLLTLALPTSQPALARLEDRGMRERLFRASVARGSRGNEHDTRETLTRTVALRAERAALLGHDSHADYAIADETARTVNAVTAMLGALVGPAVQNARREAAELEQALTADGGDLPLQAWDWAYYAEKVRGERFAVDAEAVRPYLELGRVLKDGVLHAAAELYGLRFEPRPDLPHYGADPADVDVYEVFDGDGRGIGLFLADWYARDSKRGGAWMSSFLDQSRLLGHAPVVVMSANVPRPPAGEPALLTLDMVVTVFHEFGHVLHGLLSDVTYPRFSGTSVPHDFVEYPSQVNEMWAWWPEVLSRYAVHHETGKPLKQKTVDRLLAARSYGEGFATTELLAAALLDLEWHRRAAAAAVTPDGVEAFERAALARHGIDLDLVPPRYRTPYFAHVFAGQYSAGYYAYLWSEVLDADTVEWFVEHGGLQRRLGDTFRRELLARGGSVDPMAAFEAVLGRPPRVEPLLERRGLVPG